MLLNIALLSGFRQSSVQSLSVDSIDRST